jgi:outer membrane protein OmpA-like peptidoglycan-associated protein
MSLAKRWGGTALALAVTAGVAGVPGRGAAQLGGLVDKFKKKAEQKVDQAEQQAVDSAFNQGEQAVRCVAGDQKCVDKAKKDGKKVVLTDAQGKPLPQDAKAADAAKGEAAPAKAERVGEGAWANYEFVPGARVLYSEDFARDRVGNFPKRLEFTQGNMEVVDWKGRRLLRITSESKLQVPLAEKLPERFTIEMDVTVPWWGMRIFGGPGGRDHSWVELSGSRAGLFNAQERGGATVDPRDVYAMSGDTIAGKLVRLRVAGDGRYVKVYVDEHRVANVPNADFQRTTKLYVESTGFPPPGEHGNIPTLIASITVAAGGPELYDALVADGRVVTQGILFDTGSDLLRPESTPTLKEIGAMLQEHPELKLRIEGHTDNVGQTAANQTLSEKRAAAVKAWLVAQGVEARRLEAKGFGQTRPVAGNETPEGRQNNRRVELVKM